MGQALYASLPEARALYDAAGEILGYDLAKLCFEGPQEKLDSTVISQPALFVTSLAILESLRSEQPEMVDRCGGAAGLSLGEYTALVFAGVLSFEDGLRVVQRRARKAGMQVRESGVTRAQHGGRPSSSAVHLFTQLQDTAYETAAIQESRNPVPT